jgi:hypothetical protein
MLPTAVRVNVASQEQETECELGIEKFKEVTIRSQILKACISLKMALFILNVVLSEFSNELMSLQHLSISCK